MKMERESHKSSLEEGWNETSVKNNRYAVYEKGDERLLYRSSTGQVISRCNVKDHESSVLNVVYSKLKNIVSSERRLW